MSQIDLQQLSKLYYTIGEVSSLFNVNASLIRFWEKEFGFEIAKKTKKGNRLFTIQEIEKINKIYQLVKIQGYTIEGARKQLQGKKDFISKNNSSNNLEIIGFLEQLKEKLQVIKNS